METSAYNIVFITLNGDIADSNISYHLIAANALYDYPFTTVLSLAVPIAGLTLREQMKVHDRHNRQLLLLSK